MTDEDFATVLDLAVASLREVTNADWSTRAGTLDWSCWQTIDHIIDCVFSDTMQVAAAAEAGFLPFGELHALPAATLPSSTRREESP
jgi:hypothetical protein